MKKLPFILLLFLFNTSYSQYAKGSYIIGADLRTNYSLDSYRNSSSNNLNLGVTGSVFISDRIVVGVSLSESFNTYPDNNNLMSGSTQNKMYGAGLLAKYYQKLSPRTGFVCGSSLSYQYGENSLSYFSTSNPQYAALTKLNLTAGLYCFVYKKLAIEATYDILNVQYLKQWNDDHMHFSQTYEGLNMNLSLFNPIPLGNINFSVLYFFNRSYSRE